LEASWAGRDMLPANDPKRTIMPGRSSHFNQSAAISKAIEARTHADSFKEHLRQIAESAAFKGSDRSREFLIVIVEKALAGHFDDLKERVLGVELFGRDASYDTGEDAIVRVTASDVRRRLARYYTEFGSKSGLRLELPVGSYIPEFIRVEEPEVLAVEETLPVTPARLLKEEPPVPPRSLQAPLLYSLIGVALGMLLWAAVSRFLPSTPATELLPWSALLQTGQRLQIVVSDTELSKMETVAGYNLSLSDYANHKYLPPNLPVSPEVNRVLSSFRGLSMGAVDVNIAMGISGRVFREGQQLSIQPARGLELKDFRTDDNFVILGSPRSDPWASLFQDQLDFQFFYDTSTSQEMIRNRRRLKDEPAIYNPSARGWGTGQAFGLISFTANPNQTGHVLLIAGSSAEATEAAGRVALDRDAMARTLKANGITPAAGAVPFQILLRVETMAGSPNSFSVVAFHKLQS
jgi:hypothetical protein